MRRLLFLLCLFLSAVLLFSIQPMVAKALLPVYGGSPAVWTVCMLFFQAVLLVAYAYVVGLSYLQKTFAWRLTHSGIILLSFFALPIIFHPLLMESAPEWSIIYTLLMQLGLPLLVIGASAPLLQFAYSQTKEKGAADPYFLYTASNLGSLLSLLIYPWVIERFIGLKDQFALWTKGYVLYILLLGTVLFVTAYTPLQQQKEVRRELPWTQIGYWIFLSFVPCSLMLGLTLYITTDIAATPLFWILPLSLYLLTFVLMFTQKPLIPYNWIARNCIFFLVFALIEFLLKKNQVIIWQSILCHLLSFFCLALLCHGQLYLKRPKPQLLTLFYFCLALGGVLAGVFNGIIAPHVFHEVYEYPLAILLSLWVLPGLPKTGGWWVPLVVLGFLVLHYVVPESLGFGGLSSFQVGALAAVLTLAVWQKSKVSLLLSVWLLFLFIFAPQLQDKTILLQERNFYGVKQVVATQNVHTLINQSTIHGLQIMGERAAGTSSYYGAVQPVVKAMQEQGASLKVTIIGLGVGTMLCQFRESDEVQVIEIDEQVIGLAKNPLLFTYLRDCPARILKSDGRLALARLPNHSQNLLVVDAFNSDAIPIHLLTLDAFSLYQQKIIPEGGILVNLSNRHLNLLPVLNAIGRSLDMIVMYVLDKGKPALGQFPAQWAFLTTNQDLALHLMKNTDWRFDGSEQQFLWTDDYSNLIPLLRW